MALQYWKIQGETSFYAVGLSDSLAGAVTADGQAASATHLVGGVYCYQYDDPARFVLTAGMGVDPYVLDPAKPGEKGLVDALRNLPLVYQAA